MDRFKMCLKRLAVVAITIYSGVAIAAAAEFENHSVLSFCYLKLMLAQQVLAQAEKLADTAAANEKQEVVKAAEDWWQGSMTSIRETLVAQFGDNSRARFEKFISEFESAEKNKDPDFLATTIKSLGIMSAPADYGSMRKAAVETVLAGAMKDSSHWLSELQTWIAVRQKDKGTPSLKMWLARDVRLKTEPLVVKKPKSKADLASAEVVAQDFTPEKDAMDSPLDSFSTLRKQKREKAAMDAQAGMQQVAAERQAAETEYAAKKASEAQADADSMKAQAEKLAAAEKDALEQRQNSFGAKLKAIVGATVSSAVGAFTGGIGARAGQEAVDAVFSIGDKRN